jgi:hypothetical protein
MMDHDVGRREGCFDPLAAASRPGFVPRGHFWFTIHVDGQTPMRRGGTVIEPVGHAPSWTEAI